MKESVLMSAIVGLLLATFASAQFKSTLQASDCKQEDKEYFDTLSLSCKVCPSFETYSLIPADDCKYYKAQSFPPMQYYFIASDLDINFPPYFYL